MGNINRDANTPRHGKEKKSNQQCIRHFLLRGRLRPSPVLPRFLLSSSSFLQPSPEIYNNFKMRLFVCLLPLISFLLLPVSAKFGPSCFKVVAALASRPGDLYDKFQREICDRGCQPTVPHWDLWTRNNTFVPAVHSVLKRLNVPRQEQTMVELGDDVATIIKVRCGAALGDRHICADPNTLAGFGNCFKKNFLKAAIVHLPKLLPMASEEVCREQLAYLKDGHLWENIIPQNMRDYAQVCQDLEGNNFGMEYHYEAFGF